MENELQINKAFFITYLIPLALKENKVIYINMNQYHLVQRLCDEMEGAPLDLDPNHDYAIRPEIIVDEYVPSGEYRLFSQTEYQNFKLENEPGTWHNYFKSNPIPVHGHFNCAGDYIQTTEITRKENDTNEKN